MPMSHIYEKYLSMEDVPAGKILEVILKKKNISQKELANMSNEYPQRICAYIRGKRKFTIKASLAIEKALDIDIEGFFLKIQTNHDIYSYVMEEELKIHPDLLKLSKGLFWDTRIEKINWIRNKKWVIKRVFEYGNDQEINEIIRFYGKDTIKSVFSQIKSNWNSTHRNDNYQKYII
jgi:plasmid maintenance system antidote protein VapI